MPTSRSGKVRRMLHDGKAKFVKRCPRCPFTVQLLYDTGDTVQEVSLGIDAGSKHIGVSATTGSEELYAGEVERRNDIYQIRDAAGTLLCMILQQGREREEGANKTARKASQKAAKSP